MELGIVIIVLVTGFGVANVIKKLDTIEKRINEIEESLAGEIRDNGINQSQDEEF